MVQPERRNMAMNINKGRVHFITGLLAFGGLFNFRLKTEG
jgi:hypothetical protein